MTKTAPPGTISTLAPIFATAYIAGSKAALLVGLAAALGALISMGMSASASSTSRCERRSSRSRWAPSSSPPSS